MRNIMMLPEPCPRCSVRISASNARCRECERRREIAGHAKMQLARMPAPMNLTASVAVDGQNIRIDLKVKNTDLKAHLIVAHGTDPTRLVLGALNAMKEQSWKAVAGPPVV